MPPGNKPLEDGEPAQRVPVFGPLRCRIQGAGGESRERDERERNTKLELKGNKTGHKNNLQKFILFVRSPGGVQQQR